MNIAPLFACWLVLQADGVEAPLLRVGSTTEGAIVDTDARVHTEAIDKGITDAPVIGKRYRIEVEASGTYTIELRSYLFDAYLVLRDEEGHVLREDDDGLLGTQARITAELRANTRGVIEVCALHGGRGEFELRLVEGAPARLAPGERQAAELDDAKRSLALREKVLGPEHPDTAGSLNHLAALLQARGDLDGARPLFERALAIREKVFGPEHLVTATSLNSLALLRRARGDLDGARPLYERALSIYEKVLGPEHPDTATGLNNLGVLLWARGDLESALPLLKRALAIWEKVLGPEHPDTASGLNNLATLLQARGDFDGALPLLERALAIREKILGPEHPDTARSLNDLGLLLWARGDFDRARPLYERALAIRERVLGPEHPDTAGTLNNLALLLQARGEFDGARPLFERALAICEKVLGREHPFTASSLNNLAALLVDRGDFDAARPLHERALSIREKVLGPEHPDTATSLNNLALLLQARGDFDGARPLFERALAIWEKALGPEHPDTARCLENLALLLRDRGEFDGALPLLERARAICEKSLGPEHPFTASSLNNLALLLQARGDFDRARLFYERALEIYEAVLGREHPYTALCLTNLSFLSADEGDRASATAFIQQSLQSSRASRLVLLEKDSERESCLYLATLRRHIDGLVSLSLDRDAAEAILAWKHQSGRALHASHAGIFAHLSTDQASALETLRGVQSRLSKLAFAREIRDREAHKRELAELHDERERLERSLQAAVDVLLPAPPTLKEIRKALPAQAAWVDLFVHRVYAPAKRNGDEAFAPGRFLEPHVSAWITRPDREECVHVDLGTEASVQESVTTFLHEILARDGEAVVQRGVGVQPTRTATSAGQRLRRLLWDPLAAKLDGVTRVFVSPDGPVATLPFETLALDDGGFLVEQFSFVYLQSADSLTTAHGATTVGGSLLAAGGVDYSHRSTSDAASPASDGAPSPALLAAASPRSSASRGSDLRSGFPERWMSLESTRPESELVKRLHGTAFVESGDLLLEGVDATEERLKRELPIHSIAHIATHGFFNPEGIPSLWRSALEETQKEQSGMSGEERVLAGRAPGLLSGLVCAGVNAAPEEGRDDGYLTADEVGWLDLSQVELVVLSACETGLGRSESGEGLLGLRRAFELAGAKTVVSSLWSVQDDSTARLMQSFYENLWLGKMGRADALRAAQLEMLARNRAQYHDPLPSTWGAFVLSGEWR